MPDPTYLHCHCPTCKRPLDDVPITAPICLLCNQPLKPEDVWLTRRYPGIILLPGWLRAFGWPFLLILAGIGFFFWEAYWLHAGDIRLPALFISIGIVYFFVMLATDGET